MDAVEVRTELLEMAGGGLGRAFVPAHLTAETAEGDADFGIFLEDEVALSRVEADVVAFGGRQGASGDR